MSLTRLYEPALYAPEPVPSYWEATVARPPLSPSEIASHTCDVAIVGGGYTGLSAALELAQSGYAVTVLEANALGWGASGRNGGFACLGGTALPRAAQIRRFGAADADALLRLQARAVHRVEEITQTHGIEVDPQPGGEVCVAHRPGELELLRSEAEMLSRVLGVETQIWSQEALSARGFGMAGSHGAMWLGLGFGVHPLKLALGLADAARAAGAKLCAHSPVARMSSEQGVWSLTCTGGTQVRARKVIVATNGYSSEGMPAWLGGRYLPVLSNIMVTRPLTGAELQAQGWTARTPSYDSRSLLHYFRLLPDNRMLFGMRGNVRATQRETATQQADMRRHFGAMFPAWADVEAAYQWSGLACVTLDRLSYIGPVPGMEGIYAGLGWHGNGVAMGVEAGVRLAALAKGARWEETVPRPVRSGLRRFPIARWRRGLLPLVYGWYRFRDGAPL